MYLVHPSPWSVSISHNSSPSSSGILPSDAAVNINSVNNFVLLLIIITFERIKSFAFSKNWQGFRIKELIIIINVLEVFTKGSKREMWVTNAGLGTVGRPAETMWMKEIKFLGFNLQKEWRNKSTKIFV